ncbi:efflux RND transporter permease subunit [Desulfovibrio sp. OttesenSCG-928-C06]|nr:efflux RND transporter permease subunit [Desulfovibrio sp. OttesenSCG-928-C06]
MNLSSLFIRRPVATALLMIGILVAGLMGYRVLPVADLPSVDFPTIMVRASLSGASPETMAASVAIPLEKQFSTIAGLDSMTSVNSMGSTRIVLQFNLGRDIDAAAQDVQTAIAAAQRSLPEAMPSPPSMRKVNPADSPIFYITLTSDTMRQSDVNEYAENFMAQRLSMVNGVAQVNVYGSQKYAVRIQVDPQAMAAVNLGIDEVATALRSGNTNLAIGTLKGPNREYTIQSSGKLMNADEFRPLVVVWRDGAPVRLHEIAKVTDSVENDQRRSWYNNKRSMVLAIQRQPGTNTVEVVDGIKKMLPSLRAQIPAAIELNILFDRSESIRESVHDVKFTMVLTICLVIAVIFVFLRNLSATLIPSLAVPLSIIGACGIMHVSGFSLNNISLMALTLSVGYVVDDAIVMLENIVRHMEGGKSAMQAAMDGSCEIGFTILSMTISLVAVFIPVLFLGGIVGRLFHEFAVTIAAAILISGVVALTLTPMLCSRFLRPQSHRRMHEGFYGKIERAFTALYGFYERTLKAVLRHKGKALLVSFAFILATGYMFKEAPKGFLPFEDIGNVDITVEVLQGISFEGVLEYQRQIAEIVMEEPNLLRWTSTVGASGPQSSMNNFSVFLRYKDKSDRNESIQSIIQRLRKKIGAIPGVRAFVNQPPPLRIGGSSSKALYQFTLQSTDTTELYASADSFRAKMAEIPGVIDVNSDLMLRNPELRVDINRDKCAALGITPAQVEEALSNAYSTRKVSTILAPTNDYEVILELLPEFRDDVNALNYLYIRSKNGNLVPLATLVELKTSVGPLTVNHNGQLPSVTVSFNLAQGFSIGEAVAAVERLAATDLPDSISTSFQGTAQAFRDSLGNLWLLLLMAVVVIYIVLGMLYESFIHPLTILSGLPSAALGALATLLIFGKDLDIYGFVGIIMLLGIVKKNAIMMIDFALEAQRKHGQDTAQSITQGALVRFRPILMTTLAALMGALPIAYGYGAGGEARQPLGLAVAGGLIVSQVLTLYITPVYYIYLDKAQQWLRRRFSRKSRGLAAESE